MALVVLLRLIAPLVVVAFSTAAWTAPDWPMAPPPNNVSVPPTLAPVSVSAEASVRVALSEPAVVRFADATVLPEFERLIAPWVVVAFTALAWIAPVCPMDAPLDKVSAPPILALAMVRLCVL